MPHALPSDTDLSSLWLHPYDAPDTDLCPSSAIALASPATAVLRRAESGDIKKSAAATRRPWFRTKIAPGAKPSHLSFGPDLCPPKALRLPREALEVSLDQVNGHFKAYPVWNHTSRRRQRPNQRSSPRPSPAIAHPSWAD